MNLQLEDVWLEKKIYENDEELWEHLMEAYSGL